MASIQFENISKSFGDTKVLKNINLEIKEGEFLVLIGPSGCGKSTSLRMIAGLENVTSGEILIDGKYVKDVDPSKRDIAMVFQNYALYPHMSIFENMAFGLKLRKVSKQEINQKVNEVAKLLKIESYLDKKPKELSGGQRQRVALGRAIVREPKIFLFDEPLSNLDAKLRQEMRVEIKKLHSLLKTTMVYVTHDQTEALTMGDRIAVMKDGEIVQLDSPQNLYDSPQNQFVASFIGSPQMNFISGEIIELNNQKLFKAKEIELLIDSRHHQFKKLNSGHVTMGLRPEHIYDQYFSEIENDQSKFKAKTVFLENLGASFIAHLEVKGVSLVAQFNRNTKLEIDKDMKVIIDMMQSYFYDIKSGELL
ncbi:MAG: sugar ABC transporter ATP-binding protein [Candidatus Marinimicrobia bacterium]|nr:sugar ABC transporter ATP-binding protein [Candidatus Neomarinimicrobiota bacterium]